MTEAKQQQKKSKESLIYNSLGNGSCWFRPQASLNDESVSVMFFLSTVQQYNIGFDVKPVPMRGACNRATLKQLYLNT